MRIFYSASKSGQNPELDRLVCVTIPEMLERLGHDVESHIYDPGNTSNESAVFDDVAKRVLSADVFIGEMSKASQTLGFQLSYALSNTKPCLYLYHADRNAKPGAIIKNNPSRLLKIKAYDSTNLQKTLEEFLQYAEGQNQSVRTSFMSTRSIDDYISRQSKRLGISKGEVIRNALDTAAKIDAE